MNVGDLMKYLNDTGSSGAIYIADHFCESEEFIVRLAKHHDDIFNIYDNGTGHITISFKPVDLPWNV